MTEPLPRLSASQAAARLGVRQQTLYAYVSRGLLSRERGALGSTFDPLEVEAFASSRRRSVASPIGTASGSPLMVLDTDIALIEDGELYFRGVPASELALGASFESVARWLWGAPAVSDDELRADADAVASARAAVAALPPSATALDRLQVAIPVLGASDPTRHDLQPATVRAAAERLIAGVVEASGMAGIPGGGAPAEQRAVATPQTIAAALWQALAGRPASAAQLRAMNAALVLFVDHDLAASTMAVRAAASARATPYAVVSSGLGALDSALHGNASGAAAELIQLVLDGTDARAALACTVARTARPAPGFGQPLYPGIDARAAILLPLVAAMPGGDSVVDAVDALTREVVSRTGRHPNVDLALAALTTAAGMPADAGAAIFAVGRMAGWIAHALDEYGQQPLRLRPRGRYVGPRAASGSTMRMTAGVDDGRSR
ncbi:citrate synthase [Humibacter sp.]|uniref:citrate synthase n=1 Tax=Humibacter sp. TaxID=1940291 RepID=UPI002C727A91|nr:citrate synthase [Humibacter sp.]HVX08460.1 citrate synthase [Humibacter sp.]